MANLVSYNAKHDEKTHRCCWAGKEFARTQEGNTASPTRSDGPSIRRAR